MYTANRKCIISKKFLSILRFLIIISNNDTREYKVLTIIMYRNNFL